MPTTSYTWAEFKAEVGTFLTDRRPTNETFAAAAQEYVRARIQLDLLNDKDGYTLKQRRYTELRKTLFGWSTTASDSTLRAAVKALLRDTSATNVLYNEAVANFVRAQWGEEGRGGIYNGLRMRLAGYVTTDNEANLRLAVKALLRDSGASSDLFTQAVAEWVRSRMGVEGAAARYASLKRGLAGFNVANDATLKANVRLALSDGPRTNSEFALACSLFARAQIAREIDARDAAGIQSAMAVHESARKEYERIRLRLAGFNHTFGSSAALVTEVEKYLPVDKVRANTSTYLATVVANAAEDIQSFGTWIDAQIGAAKADLDGVDAWLNIQISTAQSDLAGFGTWIDTQVDYAKGDIQAMSARISKELRAAVIDLQQFVRAFQVGHSVTIVAADVDEDGNASFGTLPANSQIRSARIKRFDSAVATEPVITQAEFTTPSTAAVPISAETTRIRSIAFLPGELNAGSIRVGYRTTTPIMPVPFNFDAVPGKAYDLSEFVVKAEVAGDKVSFIATVYDDAESDQYRCVRVDWDDRYEKLVQSTDCAARMAIDPKGQQFMVTPKLVEDYSQLLLTYDGTRLEFADGDTVPFDEAAARAVAMWVNAAMALEWGEAAAQIGMHQGEYMKARTRLHLRHRDRVEVRP